MEVVNKHTAEEIFDFFRNVLNILPTHEQKKYISNVHLNKRTVYSKNDRQIGKTIIICAYFLWLIEMAEICKKDITIIIGCKNYMIALQYIKTMNELNNGRVSFNKHLDNFKFGQYCKIKVSWDADTLIGIRVDYLYANGMNIDNIREGSIKTIQVLEPIMTHTPRFVMF